MSSRIKVGDMCIIECNHSFWNGKIVRIVELGKVLAICSTLHNNKCDVHYNWLRKLTKLEQVLYEREIKIT